MTTDATLAADIDATCRLTGEFTLRSGQVADTYFDKYLFEAQPALLDRVAARMVDLLPEGTELLGGLELGGIPIATMVSAKTGLPALFVRKKAKEYGTGKLAEGPDVAGRRVTIIEDVITTGGAVRDATRALRELGAIVEVVVCAIDRQPGGREPAGRRRSRGPVGADPGRPRRRPRLSVGWPGSSGSRRPADDVAVGPPSCGRSRHRRLRAPVPPPLEGDGTTEKARITMISLSMLSPSVGNASRQEEAEQADRRRPTSPRRPALQRKNRCRSIRVTPATTVM